MNPFHNQNIIQILGKSCSVSDKETLKKLREVSAPYYNILNKTYFDLLQIKINVDIRNKKLSYSFPNGSSERELEFKDWEPKIAQRIRILQFTVSHVFDSCYIDIIPSSIQNMNMYDLLLNQIFPHITTLKLYDLPKGIDTRKVLNFIRQFNNLKNMSLRIYLAEPAENEEEHLNDIKSILSTLKSSGIFVELRLHWFRVDEMENILRGPGNTIKNHIHQLGFDIPLISEEEELGRFAHIVTENQSIISDIKLSFNGPDFIHAEREDPENILRHLRVISPFVTSLGWNGIAGVIDIFASISWSSLITLKLWDYFLQLPDLSISCPKLQTLRIQTTEDEAFFANADTTHEQALQNIFGGCAKSLKLLTISSPDWHDRSTNRIKRDNHLHEFLRKLLPCTEVKVDPEEQVDLNV